MVTSLFDENGRYLKGTQRTFELIYAIRMCTVAMKAGLTVKEGFDIPPGRYLIGGARFGRQLVGAEIRGSRFSYLARPRWVRLRAGHRAAGHQERTNLVVVYVYRQKGADVHDLTALQFFDNKGTAHPGFSRWRLRPPIAHARKLAITWWWPSTEPPLRTRFA